MKAIIAALQLAMTELRARANTALQGVGPVDQFEGSQEVACALRSLKWAEESVTEMLSKVDTVMQKFDPEVQAAACALVDGLVADRIAAGELMAKADVELAVAAAEKTGRETAEAAASQREQIAAQKAARIGEITTAHGAEVAALLPDNVIAAETFDAVKTELARRVTALAEMGVTAATKKNSFQEIACGIAFDEAGAAAFDAKLESVKELIGPRTPEQVAASTRTAVPGSGQPTAPSKTGDPDAIDAPKPKFAF